MCDPSIRRQQASSPSVASVPVARGSPCYALIVWRLAFGVGEGRLFHVDVEPFGSVPGNDRSALSRWLVRNVYANHNNSPAVRAALRVVVARVDEPCWGLNFGAGGTTLGERFINLDVVDRPSVDIVTRGSRLPFRTGSLRAVVAQEVLEHLPSPTETLAEVHRVPEVGGVFYCQVPFIIGYHPGPSDFWRFTREGLEAPFPASLWHLERTVLASVTAQALTGSPLSSRPSSRQHFIRRSTESPRLQRQSVCTRLKRSIWLLRGGRSVTASLEGTSPLQ